LRSARRRPSQCLQDLPRRCFDAAIDRHPPKAERPIRVSLSGKHGYASRVNRELESNAEIARPIQLTALAMRLGRNALGGAGIRWGSFGIGLDASGGRQGSHVRNTGVGVADQRRATGDLISPTLATADA
jgi:hypothetical protein